MKRSYVIDRMGECGCVSDEGTMERVIEEIDD